MPLEEVRKWAQELAEDIAENAPLAVVPTRATLRQDLAREVEVRIIPEFAEQPRLSASAEALIGTRTASESRLGILVGAA